MFVFVCSGFLCTSHLKFGYALFLLGPRAERFSLNTNTGELRSSSPLSHSERAEYTLTVTATDRGLPPRSTSCSLTIQVRLCFGTTASTNTHYIHLFDIKEQTQGSDDLHPWAPRTSCRHISLTSDKVPSHPLPFSSPVNFQKGNFYLKWKSGSESNTPSWLVMRASCRRL